MGFDAFDFSSLLVTALSAVINDYRITHLLFCNFSGFLHGNRFLQVLPPVLHWSRRAVLHSSILQRARTVKSLACRRIRFVCLFVFASNKFKQCVYVDPFCMSILCWCIQIDSRSFDRILCCQALKFFFRPLSLSL